MAKHVKVNTTLIDRISQGDIIKDVEFIEYAIESEGNIEISKIKFPLVIVLTQDCDLNQDHRFRNSDPPKATQDKQLMSVLVAPIYNVEHFYDGTHLEKIDLKMAPFEKRPSKTKNKLFITNKIPRFHYLKFPDSIPIVESVIDFKHYFSVNVKNIEILKKTNFAGKVSELFREDISQRFSSFLARIGLPE
ncbi:hypothetical protein ACFL3T_04935 [Patescibacteria group bacterium]